MPRLTLDQWQSIRAEREAGAGYHALAKKYFVDVAAIYRRAKRENWGDAAEARAVIRRLVNSRVNSVNTTPDPAAKAAAIEATADEAAAVVLRHRREWEEHRARFGIVPANAEQARVAKLAAEALRLRQEAERRAWNLDVQQPAEVVIGNPRTFDA